LLAPSAISTAIVSIPAPADDETGISVAINNLSVYLYDTTGDTFNYTITFVSTGDTITVTGAVNGTKTLDIPSSNLPLTGLTVYQWTVNMTNLTSATDGTKWVNTSYNFTTGTHSRMSEYSGFSATQLLLVGMILIVVALVVIMYVIDIMNNKKLDVDKLVGAVVVVIILVVIAGLV